MQIHSRQLIDDPWARSLAAFWQYYRFPITIGLALRAGLSLWLAAVWWIMDPYLPLKGKALNETYGQLVPHGTRLGRALFDVWLRWDAVHYMNIARQGYAGVGQGDMNFFPLYPYLTLLIKTTTGLQEVGAGLLLSTGMAILALCLLYRLAGELFPDARLARWTVVAWGLYPTSFFLFAPYTEALFSACALGSLLLMLQRKWTASGLLAILAGLTRVQGALLVLPMLVLAYQDWQRSRRVPWHAIPGIMIAPLGFLGFTAWRATQGTGFYTHSFSQYSRILFLDPISGYFQALWFAVRVHDYISVSEAISATIFLGLILWMLLQKRYRPYLALTIFCLANLALFTSKNTLTASPIQSTNRYVLSLFPVFIVIAELLLRLPERGRKLYLILSLILLLLAATMQALWLFIG